MDTFTVSNWISKHRLPIIGWGVLSATASNFVVHIFSWMCTNLSLSANSITFLQCGKFEQLQFLQWPVCNCHEIMSKASGKNRLTLYRKGEKKSPLASQPQKCQVKNTLACFFRAVNYEQEYSVQLLSLLYLQIKAVNNTAIIQQCAPCHSSTNLIPVVWY